MDTISLRYKIDPYVYYPKIKELIIEGESFSKACVTSGIDPGTFTRNLSPKLLNELKDMGAKNFIIKNNPLTAKIIEAWVNNPNLNFGEIANLLDLKYHTVTHAVRKYLPKNRGRETEVLVLPSKINFMIGEEDIEPEKKINYKARRLLRAPSKGFKQIKL